MSESEKILRRHGHTVDSFEDSFIKPLKKSGAARVISSSNDLEWMIDIAFRYFDLHIGVKHIEGLRWQLFVVEEPSLTEIYFG